MSTRETLFQQLDSLKADSGLPSVVVADTSGLLIAAAKDATTPEETAALAALRVEGNPARGELVDGRVKARSIEVGAEQVVVGALGDTAICAQVFDALEGAVRDGLSRHP